MSKQIAFKKYRFGVCLIVLLFSVYISRAQNIECIRGTCKEINGTPEIPTCKANKDIPAEVSVAHVLTQCDTSKIYHDMTCNAKTISFPVTIYKVNVTVNESLARLTLCGLSSAACIACLEAAWLTVPTTAKVASKFCSRFQGIVFLACEAASGSAAGIILYGACSGVCAFTNIDACCFLDISLGSSRTDWEDRVGCVF
jgi:hypothetical protein